LREVGMGELHGVLGVIVPSLLLLHVLASVMWERITVMSRSLVTGGMESAMGMINLPTPVRRR